MVSHLKENVCRSFNIVARISRCCNLLWNFVQMSNMVDLICLFSENWVQWNLSGTLYHEGQAIDVPCFGHMQERKQKRAEDAKRPPPETAADATCQMLVSKVCFSVFCPDYVGQCETRIHLTQILEVFSIESLIYNFMGVLPLHLDHAKLSWILAESSELSWDSIFGDCSQSWTLQNRNTRKTLFIPISSKLCDGNIWQIDDMELKTQSHIMVFLCRDSAPKWTTLHWQSSLMEEYVSIFVSIILSVYIHWNHVEQFLIPHSVCSFPGLV